MRKLRLSKRYVCSGLFVPQQLHTGSPDQSSTRQALLPASAGPLSASLPGSRPCPILLGSPLAEACPSGPRPQTRQGSVCLAGCWPVRGCVKPRASERTNILPAVLSYPPICLVKPLFTQRTSDCTSAQGRTFGTSLPHSYLHGKPKIKQTQNTS